MHTRSLSRNLFLIDLQTGGFKNLIGSYVLKGEKVAIVETGPTSSIPNLLSGLRELVVNAEDVAYVALTHVHIDHAGGVGSLLRNLPNAKVIVHKKGAQHLVDPSRLWDASQQTLGNVADMFGAPESVAENRLEVASEGMNLDLGGNVSLKILETTGHSSHSLSFYEPSSEGLFTGDSAGAYLVDFDCVFPTTPPPFRPDMALISLDKLISFNPKKLYYTHFGDASPAVSRLRNYQVQIRRWLNIVKDSLKQDETAQETRERVLHEDESIRRAVPALRANPVHRKTLIENSVQGFIDFARHPTV